MQDISLEKLTLAGLLLGMCMAGNLWSGNNNV